MDSLRMARIHNGILFQKQNVLQDPHSTRHSFVGRKELFIEVSTP